MMNLHQNHSRSIGRPGLTQRGDIRDLGVKNARERIASFLRSLVPVSGEPINAVPLILSRLGIAGLLGLTKETVSRVMAEFRRKGLIKAPRGAVHILDQDRLQTIAGCINEKSPCGCCEEARWH